MIAVIANARDKFPWSKF